MAGSGFQPESKNPYSTITLWKICKEDSGKLHYRHTGGRNSPLSDLIGLSHRIKFFPNAAGVSRAIEEGAVVWEVVHPLPMRSHSAVVPAGPFQGLEGAGPRFLAIFPDANCGPQVELFLAPEADRGERGSLNCGFIIWYKGGYSKLEFPAVGTSVPLRSIRVG
jgi:hypothetical protein